MSKPYQPIRRRKPATTLARAGAATRLNVADLRCYGCAFSTAAEPWPGRPSGDRPCHFCVRNPAHVQNVGDDHEWFDGSQPVRIPMDAYQTPDMKEQFSQWLDEAEHAGRDALDSLLRTRGLLDEMGD